MTGGQSILLCVSHLYWPDSNFGLEGVENSFSGPALFDMQIQTRIGLVWGKAVRNLTPAHLAGLIVHKRAAPLGTL